MHWHRDTSCVDPAEQVAVCTASAWQASQAAQVLPSPWYPALQAQAETSVAELAGHEVVRVAWAWQVAQTAQVLPSP